MNKERDPFTALSVAIIVFVVAFWAVVAVVAFHFLAKWW